MLKVLPSGTYNHQLIRMMIVILDPIQESIFFDALCRFEQILMIRSVAGRTAVPGAAVFGPRIRKACSPPLDELPPLFLYWSLR